MAVEIGQVAPDFTLFDSARQKVTLSEQRGKKVVIAFFPAAFTGVCEKELCTFRDSMEALNGLNAQVLAVSVDAPFANAAFAQRNQLTFPVLSDYAREATEAYGVALQNFAGMPGYTASQRAVFVVNEEGAISYTWIAPNPGVEPDYDAVKAALA
jgi:peroxiredoxin